MLAEEGAIDECDDMLTGLAAVLKRQLSVSSVSERWADDMSVKRLEWLLQWIQQIIRYASLKDELVFPHGESVKMFRYIGDKAAPQILFDLCGYIHEQLILIQGPGNPDKVLMFESILIRWQRLMLKSAQGSQS